MNVEEDIQEGARLDAAFKQEFGELILQRGRTSSRNVVKISDLDPDLLKRFFRAGWLAKSLDYRAENTGVAEEVQLELDTVPPPSRPDPGYVIKEGGPVPKRRKRPDAG